MKYLVAILLVLAVFGGYCLGTLDEGEPIKESYSPPVTLNYVIHAQKHARDCHQRLVDEPVYRRWIEGSGVIYIGTVADQREWVRMYDMTIEILEERRGE